MHLGCGERKEPGAVGVDIRKLPGVDIVHDLDRYPYPFKTGSVDRVIAVNIIEHIEDVVRTMEEIHRVCRNGARVYVATSHFSALDSFTDPTHKHFFTTRTFDYFVPGEALHEYQYSKAKYRKIRVRLGPPTTNWALKLILEVINKYAVWYEKRFAFLFPVGTIEYELEVVKKIGN